MKVKRLFERIMLYIILIFCVIWDLYGKIAKHTQDWGFDSTR